MLIFHLVSSYFIYVSSLKKIQITVIFRNYGKTCDKLNINIKYKHLFFI